MGFLARVASAPTFTCAWGVAVGAVLLEVQSRGADGVGGDAWREQGASLGQVHADSDAGAGAAGAEGGDEFAGGDAASEEGEGAGADRRIQGAFPGAEALGCVRAPSGRGGGAGKPRPLICMWVTRPI